MKRITHIVIEEDGSGSMMLETDPGTKTAEYPITAEQVELLADFMQAVWRDAGGVQA